jgi:hypothetical protein
MGKKSIAKAVLLPGILPRIKSLGVKTQHFSVLVVLLLESSRLLSPNSRVYATLRDSGHVRISDALADAWHNIKLRKYAVDKVAIFVSIILGLFILFSQTIILLLSVSLSDANAASIFQPASSSPNNDVVLTLLDQIFGPSLGIFGSGATAIGDTPIHSGLHDMLSFSAQR